MSKEELILDDGARERNFFQDLNLLCENLNMELDRLQEMALLVDYMKEKYPECEKWLSEIGLNIEESSEAAARAYDCTQGDLDQITKPKEDYD